MNKNYYIPEYKKALKSSKMKLMEPAENFIRIFKLNFFYKKKLNCLDFGVGDGRHTKFLLKNGHKVIATDISHEAIRLSKKNVKNFDRYLIFKQDNFDNISNLKKFDLIICWETIHWIGEFKKIYKLIGLFENSLKKDGSIIVTFPAEDHYLIQNNKIKNHTYKIKQDERKNALICAPKLSVLKKMFKMNNLRICQIFKYSHGRKIFDNTNNNMKSAGIRPNTMFSMYAFLLKKV